MTHRQPDFRAEDNAKDDVIWHTLGQLRDSPAVAEAYAFARKQGERQKRRGRLRALLAAALMPRVLVPLGGVAVAAAVALVVALPQPAGEHSFATATGESKTVVLEDGSTLVLDTDTHVSVAFDQNKRRLTLTRGQAHFMAAADVGRPFQVTAGGMTVTAIGTSFDVVALPGRNAVTLIEGKVVVEAAPQANRSEGPRVVLSPGHRLAVGPDGRLGPPEAVDLDSVLAWRQGRIEFDNTSVANAIAEINRYSKTKIRLLHRASARKHIDGVFRADQVEAFVTALCAYLDLEVTARSDEEIVLDRARSG